MTDEARHESALYKRLAHDLVFRSPQLQQLDFKAGEVLGKVFRALSTNYLETARPLHLLPPELETGLLTTDRSEGRRRLCDLLAELTDASATRLFRRLFEPHFGGLSDLL